MNERIQLAPGIFREPDGRIFARKTVRPSMKRKEGHFPKGTLLSQVMAEIEGWAKELRTDAQNEPGSLKIRTIGDALKLWRRIPIKKSGRKRKFTNEEKRYTRLLEDLGHVRIEESYKHLSHFMERYEGELANSTINRHIAMAKAAVNCAYNFRQGIEFTRAIPENYLSGFSLLPEDNITYRILSPEERTKLWDHLPAYLKPLYYFACRIPMRLFELVNLTRKDINLFSKIITLRSGTTKTGIGRTIVIMPEFEGYMKSFSNSGADYFFNRGAEYDFAPLGYPSKNRGGIIFNCKKAWMTALKNAGISGYNFHKTRQEAVLNLYQEGWAVSDIMHIGGWQDEDAFNRYFNKDIALRIKQGQYDMKITWYADLAADLVRKAA